jgi:hypothetical protein
MAQRAASYFCVLDTLRRARHKVLHKSLTMKHCFRLHFITPRQAAKAPQYEAAPVFISLRRDKPPKLHNMKQLPSSFHYAVASHFIQL